MFLSVRSSKTKSPSQDLTGPCRAGWDLRGQLCVVDQVFQWVAAAELVQQSRQVADDGGGVGRVDVPWYVANLHQWQVPVSVGSLRCGDLT